MHVLPLFVCQNTWPDISDGFTANFQELILGSLYLYVLPLSVCLSKYLTWHLLLNYWMDLLQIFRNYFLRSLDLHVLPLSICLSVKILDQTYPPKLLDGFTSNFQELLLKSPIFASSSVVRLSVKILVRSSPAKLLGGLTYASFKVFCNCFEVFCTCYYLFYSKKSIIFHFLFIEIIRALSQGGGESPPGGRAWKIIYMIKQNEQFWPLFIAMTNVNFNDQRKKTRLL